VGATPLSRIAAQVEDQLANSATTPLNPLLVEQFQQTVQATALAVRRALGQLEGNGKPQPHAVEHSPAPPLDTTQRTADLEALRQLLQHSDLMALDAFAALRARYADSLPAKPLVAMGQAMEVLDFASALAHLETLQSTESTV
jgi:hypothetical protein